ncbi:glycosyltransferase family 2 protein [Ammoniphilus sp. CFH 90114]|uniref:glycosyltransferase family 2 protein n=1 Tax=Ammoniphilus sp. CFH 90114 TaxID=2493665 RepID=UPI00100FC532|nr:glycosyltransferase family 2 protein [Ammoniphilus sp. CFH 90114]RXT04507.1 glycosyltransferase family 2 protein [Ammoniphilus sp. CFH 90114]
MSEKYESSQVDILLSTYNGSKYLNELLSSIINQTYKEWRLIIRDDGSTDDTMNLIRNYSEKHPKKISIIYDHRNLGPSLSFSELLKYCDANYIMFCDQDDVWLNNKIELTIEKMHLLEREFPSKPLLLHTDLLVVDEHLQLISKSFWHYQNLNSTNKNLNHLLVQNIVTGCTMMINKRLKELACPIPNHAIMHDWWIGLVASLYSGIHHMNVPLILYRQHSENNTGAKKYSLKYLASKYGKVNESIKRIFNQGASFKIRFNSQLNIDQARMLDCFIDLVNKNRIYRLISIFKYRFCMSGVLRNIGFIATIFFWRKKR